MEYEAGAMKAIWFCMLLSLLSILAYSGFSDALSGAGAPGTPGNDAGLAARLSEYVFLHETRNERIPAKPAAGLSTCPE